MHHDAQRARMCTIRHASHACIFAGILLCRLLVWRGVCCMRHTPVVWLRVSCCAAHTPHHPCPCASCVDRCVGSPMSRARAPTHAPVLVARAAAVAPDTSFAAAPWCVQLARPVLVCAWPARAAFALLCARVCAVAGLRTAWCLTVQVCFARRVRAAAAAAAPSACVRASLPELAVRGIVRHALWCCVVCPCMPFCVARRAFL